MLQALAQQRCDREIWGLHGARNGGEHPFATEARALLLSLPNARSHVYDSRPGPEDVEGATSTVRDVSPLVSARRTDATLRCRGIPLWAHRLHGRNQRRSGLLRVDAPRIHTEPFGPAAGETPGIAPWPRRGRPTRPPASPVTAPRSHSPVATSRSHGAVTTAPCSNSPSSCDVPVRWSCRNGVCHTCETTLIVGDVEYSPDPVEPPAEGSVFISCSQPRVHIVLDL